MHRTDPTTPLDRFVSARPELRRLLENLEIDSRRDDSSSLAEVCRQHNLDLPTVARLITALPRTKPPRPVVTLELLTLSELCDHLEHAQHAIMQDELACLDRVTATAVEELGAEHPHMLRIREAFVAFREKFVAHLHEEAEELFPLIRQLATGEMRQRPARSVLKSYLARMENEHNQTDEALADLDALAGDEPLQRPVPVGLQTVSNAIVRLQHAVHNQIYKENQVLFPRALAHGDSP